MKRRTQRLWRRAMHRILNPVVIMTGLALSLGSALGGFIKRFNPWGRGSQ